MNLARPLRSVFNMSHRPDHLRPNSSIRRGDWRRHDRRAATGSPHARRQWRRSSVINLTVRLLIATLLVFNGTAGASTLVQTCHASAPQNSPMPLLHIANSDYQSVTVVADPAQAQITHVHGSHRQGMHAHVTIERVQTNGANRRCDEGCCQEMNCSSHCSAPAMIQPPAQRLLLPGAVPSRMERAALHAMTRPLAVPDRPPAI